MPLHTCIHVWHCCANVVHLWIIKCVLTCWINNFLGMKMFKTLQLPLFISLYGSRTCWNDMGITLYFWIVHIELTSMTYLCLCYRFLQMPVTWLLLRHCYVTKVRSQFVLYSVRCLHWLLNGSPFWQCRIFQSLNWMLLRPFFQVDNITCITISQFFWFYI